MRQMHFATCAGADRQSGSRLPSSPVLYLGPRRANELRHYYRGRGFFPVSLLLEPSGPHCTLSLPYRILYNRGQSQLWVDIFTTVLHHMRPLASHCAWFAG